jgi:hypothetical protein
MVDSLARSRYNQNNSFPPKFELPMQKMATPRGKIPLLSSMSLTRPSVLTNVILVLSCIAWVISTISVSQCTFFTIRSDASSDLSVYGVQQSGSMGLFSHAAYDSVNGEMLGCVDYTTRHILDAYFHAGRAFGTMTALFCTVSFLLIAAAVVFRPDLYIDLLWDAARITNLAATMTQFLTFFVLGTEKCQSATDCSLSGAGVAAILNVFVLCTATVVTAISPPPVCPWLVLTPGWSSTRRQQEDIMSNKETIARVSDISGALEYVASSDVAEQQHNDWDLRHQLEDPDNRSEIHDHVDNDENSHNFHIASPSGTSSVGGRSAGTATVHSIQSVQDSLSSVLHSTWMSSRKGRIGFLSLVFIAWVKSLVGVRRCTFLLVGPPDVGRSQYTGLGLFHQAAYSESNFIGCVDYADNTQSHFDSTFLMARVFGTTTTLCMTVIMLLVLIQLCVHVVRDELWLLQRILVPSATVSQFLTIVLAFQTDMCQTLTTPVQCVPGAAGLVAIFNLLLLTALSAIVIKYPPPPKTIFSFYQHSNRYGPTSSESSAPAGDETQVSSERLGKVNSSKDTMAPVDRQYSTLKSPDREKPINSTNGDGRDTGKGDDDRTEALTHKTGDDEGSQPLYQQPLPTATDPRTETITIQVVFEGGTKKTIKEILYPDGSKTITTIIEEIEQDSGGTTTEDDDEEGPLNDVALGPAEDQSSAASSGEFHIHVPTMTAQVTHGSDLNCPDSPQHSITSSLSSGVGGDRDEAELQHQMRLQFQRNRSRFGTPLAPRPKSTSSSSDSSRSQAGI